MEAKDFVGWTVTFYGADWSIVGPGVYYCVGLKQSYEPMLQLAKHGAEREENSSGGVGVNWWQYPRDCMRLRQGDFAP